ncbi:alkaline phosphatase family protein [Paenibacillus sp. Marseille-Q7038]
MRKIVIWSLLIVFMLISGCEKEESNPDKKELVQVKSMKGEDAKKVIFLMIDSLMSQAIDEGIKQNKLPTFQYLTEHGNYYKNMVSSFPTMSVTIDSSLITGTYPNRHHVPGLTWYSSDEKKVINYGTGPMEILKQGGNQVLKDALINLNGKHLNPQIPTIYEDLAKQGLKSGSINGLIYRGVEDHKLTIPDWLKGITSLPKEIQVKGPDFLALGSLANPLENVKDMPEGLTGRLGLNNQYSMEAVKYLIKENKLPDFLFVYLPDLDQKIHKKGPQERSGVEEVDEQLESLLQQFGSREEALNKVVFMVAGDSGMTSLYSSQNDSVVDLPSLLKGYSVLRQGESVTDETDIVLAVNETMAYVYKLNKENSLRDIANVLTSDPRIDVVSWKENDWIYALQGESRKEIKFKPNGKMVDTYQQKWTVEQELDVLDLKQNTKNQRLDYGKYPDVLGRLSGALHSHQGEFLVVTAKPGYELADRSSPTHEGGGGHGSLHEKESLVPLIICGTNEKPQYLRIIDLKPFFLKLLTKE